MAHDHRGSTMKDRTGQQVKICHEPLMVYEVTGWDAERGLWASKCVEPSPKLVPLYFRDDFLQYLDDKTRSVDASPGTPAD